MIPSSWIAVGVATLGLAGFGWLQTERLGAAQAERDAIRSQYQICLASVERQNQAVKDLENRGKEAQERGAKALEEARRAGMKARNELGRLKGLKPTSTVCPAGDAVQQVRKGLK
jgi:hypothetical protein